MKNFQVLKRNEDNSLLIEYETIAEMSVVIPSVDGVEISGQALVDFLTEKVNETNRLKAFSDIDGSLSLSLGIV